MAKDFLIEEQSCKMQGKLEYKTCCSKFKRLGDEIQGNCIANNGYTWDFYFQNEPINPGLLAQGYCPMHCQLLHMFQNLRESFYCCTMDNLFNSVKIFHATFCLKKPVLVHGALRKSGRDCPPCGFQEEKTGRATNAARSTMKAVVLKGDGQLSDLVIALCYDQKPFYRISSRYESVTWTLITKKLWSTSLQRKVDFTFLSWSMSNNNNNDIADQLRLVYWIMHFQRNNKWWWALFLWGYEVLLVSSYVSLKRYCELKGVPVPWTHHNWNEAIGYVHLDPIEYRPRRKGPFKNDDTTYPTKQDNPSDLKKKPQGWTAWLSYQLGVC